MPSNHPLSSPFPPAFNIFCHQGLFPMTQFSTSGGQSMSKLTPEPTLTATQDPCCQALLCVYV